MKLQFVHLCPQRMSLYGEYANLVVLQRMAQALGQTPPGQEPTEQNLATARMRVPGRPA